MTRHFASFPWPKSLREPLWNLPWTASWWSRGSSSTNSKTCAGPRAATRPTCAMWWSGGIVPPPSHWTSGTFETSPGATWNCSSFVTSPTGTWTRAGATVSPGSRLGAPATTVHVTWQTSSEGTPTWVWGSSPRASTSATATRRSLRGCGGCTARGSKSPSWPSKITFIAGILLWKIAKEVSKPGRGCMKILFVWPDSFVASFCPCMRLMTYEMRFVRWDFDTSLHIQRNISEDSG